MERDRRLTGTLRGQTDNPQAPLGFEFSNGWKVTSIGAWPFNRQLLILPTAGKKIQLRSHIMQSRHIRKGGIEIRKNESVYTILQIYDLASRNGGPQLQNTGSALLEGWLTLLRIVNDDLCCGDNINQQLALY